MQSSTTRKIDIIIDHPGMIHTMKGEGGAFLIRCKMFQMGIPVRFPHQLLEIANDR